MLKIIKKRINNKRGSVGLTFVVLMFILISINLLLGSFETNTSMMVITELQDIMDISATTGARSGIEESSHKNELIAKNYNTQRAKQVFIDEVMDSISQSKLGTRIKSSQQDIRSSLNAGTVVTVGSDTWVNTWQDNGDIRKIDFAIISSVLPIKLENTMVTTQSQEIEEAFERTLSNGGKHKFEVSVTESVGELGVFIKFETKVMLK